MKYNCIVINMKNIINYFKSLRKSTIYKILGIILLIGIIIWMIVITHKINNLSLNKIDSNTNVNNSFNENNISDKNEENENIEENIIINSENKIIEEDIKSNDEIKVVIPDNKNINVATDEENADDVVLSYFDNANKSLDDVNLREKGKEYFILITDFLFYDGKIKGYTFEELSTKTKLKVLQIALIIDKKINNYFPGYKEKISSTSNHLYTNVKEMIIAKYLEITTKICSSNSEACESAKRDFQDIKASFSITWDFIKNITGQGISNLKTWYEIYSGK